MSRAELVSIAKVIKSQGNKGEVAAELLTDFPHRFQQLKEVYLQKDDQNPICLRLEGSRPHKRRIVLKFSGVDDITAADGLRGHDVKIAKKNLLAPPRGSYYQFDLIDCVARDTTGRSLGKVTDILEVEGNFLLTLRHGPRELLIPFAKDIVVAVNVSKKELTCDLPEGLEEL